MAEIRRRRPSPAAQSRQREAEEKTLRTDGRHCPLCLELLPRLNGRPAARCSFCGGHPAPERRCAQCHGDSVWETDSAAACTACGHHGSKVKVFAGQQWLDESR